MRSKVKKSKTSKVKSIAADFNNEIHGIFFIALGLILITGMQSAGAGKVGEWIKFLFMGLFSNVAFLIPYLLLSFGILVFINKPFWNQPKNLIFCGLTFLSLLIFQSLASAELLLELGELSIFETMKLIFLWGTEGINGGIIGASLTFLLVKLFGKVGTYIITISILLITILIYTKISLLNILFKIRQILSRLLEKLKNSFADFIYVPDNENKPQNVITENSTIGSNNILEVTTTILDEKVDEKIKILDFTALTEKTGGIHSEAAATSTEEDAPNLSIESFNRDTTIEYIPPHIDLLNMIESPSNKEDKKKIISKAKVLENTLNNFGVEAKVIQISKGPTITRYELQPKAGVKVSRIVNLSDDIALNLAASAIRIEAPIPGKAAIGIEIPNEDIAMVTLREVIDSNNYQTSSSHLSFALGKDISGNPIVTDIAKMPHLLIAGATGSGKSVCINTLILSLLYKSTPEQVRLLLIDPKVVELNHYNGIPHLLIPVVTDPKKATGALNWAVQEMTRRYKLFAENGTRDITGYNEKFPDTTLPYIVIIIDELADLMMVAPNDVEDAICRLAQMARAAGLHLIVATQRPSVDVITGVIKANIPSRIAFSVASQADSRTILDMGGAEKLLGKGDMLFYPVGANKPVRIQGAFVSEKEVERVVNFIKEQVIKPSYALEVMEELDQNKVNTFEEGDELFHEAVKLIIETQQASISMLQRRLRIGYNRAARLIDEMEAKGVVGPHEGSKPRQVLVNESYLNIENE